MKKPWISLVDDSFGGKFTIDFIRSQMNPQKRMQCEVWNSHIELNFPQKNRSACVFKSLYYAYAISKFLTLKAPITTAADDKFWEIFPNFQKNKVWYFMRIVCQQTILMKYHALFVIFEKGKIWNCRLLQIIGGANSLDHIYLLWQT